MHHSHFKLDVVFRLGVLQVIYQIHVYQLSTSCFTAWFIFQNNIVKCEIFVALCRGILNEYLLTDFSLCYCRGPFDLHYYHATQKVYPEGKEPVRARWVPIDTELLLQHQKRLNLIPCTFTVNGQCHIVSYQIFLLYTPPLTLTALKNVHFVIVTCVCSQLSC